MRFILCTLLITLIFFACKKDNVKPIEPSEVQFGLLIDNPGGRLETSLIPDKIQVTITDEDGDLIMNNEIINLIAFGSSFISDPIRLLPGSYQLTSLLVLNEGDTAIYAAPLENSPLAQLVSDPVPIDFDVVTDQVTNVEVEVIAINDADPSEFGYVSFAPVFIATFQFEIVVFEADTANGTIQTTEADLVVTSGNDTLRSLLLEPGVNLVTVLDELAEYDLVVTKEGFDQYAQTYTLSELMELTSGNPLEVVLIPGNNGSSGSGTIVDSGQTIDASSLGVSLGDIDGDGDIDAVLAGQNVPNTIWFNDGNGFFTESSQRLLSGTSTDVELGDLDGDGDLDIFMTILSTAGNKVWINDGNGTFQDSGQAVGNQRGTGASLGDLDGDGDLDVFVTNQFANSAVWFNNGSGVFNSALTISLSNNPSGITAFDGSVVDIDADGDLDLMAVGTSIFAQLFLNDGSGSFASPVILSNDAALVVNANDFNGDNLMDILLLTGGSISHKILTQDATGGFTTELFDSDAQFSDADAADIDGDGDIDFVGATGTTVQPSIVWQNNGDASFTIAQSVLQNTGNGDVEIADLNGDGLLDLFFANDNAASVFFGQ